MKSKVELKLIDGGIKSIDCNKTYGYENDKPFTTEYITAYVCIIKIRLANKKIEIRVVGNWSHAYSKEDLTSLILNNSNTITGMTEIEFYSWIENQIEKEIKSLKAKDDYRAYFLIE